MAAINRQTNQRKKSLDVYYAIYLLSLMFALWLIFVFRRWKASVKFHEGHSFIRLCSQTNKQIDKQTNRQTNKQTNRSK